MPTFTQPQADWDQLILKYGGKRDIWLTNVDRVERFIHSNDLKPQTDHVTELNRGIVRMDISEEVAKRITVPSIYGGMRVPHLHLRRDIFLLNEKQWRDFSGQILNDFKEKLDRVNEISFPQLMELSEGINNLT